MSLSTLLFLSAALATTDTLEVSHVQYEGPYPIIQHYTTDSLNMKGKAFDREEVFSKNTAMVKPSATRRKPATTVIRQGEAIPNSGTARASLSLLRFTLEAPRFVKGQIDLSGIKDYRLFVDGVACTDKQFQLTMGRKEVIVQVLSEPTSTDTLRLRLIGDGLSCVTVNPEGKRPYTMADMTQGDHYRSVALSPSGKYLVTTSYFLKPDGSAQYETILSETTTGRELLHRNEYLALSWLRSSNDVLYYTRPAGTGRELVVYTPADGHERVLADNLPEGSFSVSPQGDYLIFSLTDEGKAPKDGLKRLDQPDDRMPGWRNRNALWRYDIASGLMQRLTFGAVSCWLSDISADGRSLLVQTSRFDAHRSPFERSTIVRMDAYTGQADTLLTDTIFISSARFSPDGRQLLVKASPAAFGGVGNECPAGAHPQAFDNRLFLYDIATRKAEPLLPRGFGPAVESYSWHPTDGRVYFTADDRSFTPLFAIDVKSRKLVRYELPVTSVQGYSIATGTKKPRAVFFGQSATRAREMFTCQLADNPRPEAERIGKINFDQLYGDVAIGTCHPWKFQASRGDSIDGFYFLPPSFDASKKYPLIVYYYGGCTPTTQCLEFQYPLQVLAGQGYVVYAVNPSGTIGYGQEFASRHVGTWGRESGDDIIEGTKKFCAAHSFVDAGHIGCMGASYGGFMTQYLQTRTDLFATAISHAGISNIASYWGGGYWGYTYGECAQYGSYPWNNPDMYVKQSPLFNADKIHTPMLLLHGTADTNVPTNESQQLFTALKILGREVCYIQIDGEDHVITNYPKRLAWQNTIFAWFAKYLKGEPEWWQSLDL